MTLYNVHSDFSIMHNAHQVHVGRLEPRTHSRASLVWSWHEWQPGEMMSEASVLTLDKHENQAFFQAFLDQAWALGLRPAHYETESNEMKATQAHLQDMRKLVFAAMTTEFRVTPPIGGCEQ